jgi:hypothetical protein
MNMPATAMALILFSLGAEAQEGTYSDSANYLLQYCKYSLVDRPLGGYNVGFGAGVCMGMVDAAGFFTRALPSDLKSCRPQGVTREQLVRVVVAYVEARPERMHEDLLGLTIEAFRNAWPCP